MPKAKITTLIELPDYQPVKLTGEVDLVKVEPPTPLPLPTIDLFSATPATITKGESVKLAWKVSGGTAEFDEKPVPPEGEFTTAPDADRTFTLKAKNAEGKTTTRTLNVIVRVPAPPPDTPPIDATGLLVIPSEADEVAAYAKMGQSFKETQRPSKMAIPALSGVANLNVHDDTEDDDLWTNTMQFIRTKNPAFRARAAAWARWFKDDYPNSKDTSGVGGARNWNNTLDRDKSSKFDHMYGYGLVAWYELTKSEGNPDTAALAAAKVLGDMLVKWYADSKAGAYWPHMRHTARHLILLTFLSVSTKDAKYTKLRDEILDTTIKPPFWDEAGVHFYAQGSVDQALWAGAYASGYRVTASFIIGLVAEAYWRIYQQTKRADVKERLISMARFVEKHGIHPKSQYTSEIFGIDPSGKTWHKYDDITPNPTWQAPSYTTTLVNTLVFGYKLTGDRKLLEKARFFWNRGTKGVYSAGAGLKPPKTPDDKVDHFIASEFQHWNIYFLWNGELLYCYLLFENGGEPAVEGTAPPPPEEPPDEPPPDEPPPPEEPPDEPPAPPTGAPAWLTGAKDKLSYIPGTAMSNFKFEPEWAKRNGVTVWHWHIPGSSNGYQFDEVNCNIHFDLAAGHACISESNASRRMRLLQDKPVWENVRESTEFSKMDAKNQNIDYFPIDGRPTGRHTYYDGHAVVIDGKTYTVFYEGLAKTYVAAGNNVNTGRPFNPHVGDVFDVEKKDWILPTPLPSYPGKAVQGNASAKDPRTQSIWIPDGGGFLHELDPKTWTYREVAPKGSPFPYQCGCCIDTKRNRIVLAGGYAKGAAPSFLYVEQATGKRQTKPITGETRALHLEPLTFCTLSYDSINDRYLFVGSWFGDILAIDPESGKSTHLANLAQNTTWQGDPRFPVASYSGLCGAACFMEKLGALFIVQNFHTDVAYIRV